VKLSLRKPTSSPRVERAGLFDPGVWRAESSVPDQLESGGTA
jgi:hypothetical protein